MRKRPAYGSHENPPFTRSAGVPSPFPQGLCAGGLSMGVLMLESQVRGPAPPRAGCPAYVAWGSEARLHGVSGHKPPLNCSVPLNGSRGRQRVISTLAHREPAAGSPPSVLRGGCGQCHWSTRVPTRLSMKNFTVLPGARMVCRQSLCLTRDFSTQCERCPSPLPCSQALGGPVVTSEDDQPEAPAGRSLPAPHLRLIHSQLPGSRGKL